MFILKIFYQLLIIVLLPLVLFVFLFFKRGRERLLERLGFWQLPEGIEVVWMHAASNGEALGLKPLIAKLENLHPDLNILLTATSVSAFNCVKEHKLICRLLPFDVIWLYRNAFRKTKIKALVIAETELWPCMLSFMRLKPVIIVNARISDYSYSNYLKIKRLLAPYITRIQKIICADKISVERFKALGALDVSYLGNMKYESSPSIKTESDKDKLRKDLGLIQAPIITLGSIHPGEEVAWLAALVEQKKLGNKLTFILAPRHLEKLPYFIDRVSIAGISYDLFSQRKSRTPVDLLIIDSFGILESCYAISSLAFIGGSLVDIGGHNPLEAAAYGTPIAMGPFHSSVRELVSQLKSAQALIEISLEENLMPLLNRVLLEDTKLCQNGANSKRVWEGFQGTTEKVYQEVKSSLTGR
jgi:3-deoxy-D-manno-octulosonic-acid transferase